MHGKAQTIQQVIDRLTEIIEWSKTTKSRCGYFAALYRMVTIRVKQQIERGYFDDGPRMERLDVLFANRYLTAFDRYAAGDRPTASWEYAFRVTRQWWPIVLQHLLLGMNAHINLDLGIAAARTVSAAELGGLQNDFNKINDTLGALVANVKNQLAQIWMVLGLLNRSLGDVESTLINFSMTKARDQAWSVAQRLAPLSELEQEAEIAKLDLEVALLGRIVRKPGLALSNLNKIIRLGERGSVTYKIGLFGTGG
jgi:hypothetical protein